jgi:hypothetical protein
MINTTLVFSYGQMVLDASKPSKKAEKILMKIRLSKVTRASAKNASKQNLKKPAQFVESRLL